ncbi:MAG: cytochrome c [Saprospiraceae bacterium]|nr:cytochrome c [Saprospiraceae bacterium]
MKKYVLFFGLALLVFACGQKNESNAGDAQATANPSPAPANDKGYGEITNVTLNDPLDQGMIQKGKAIYEMKCAACHKLTGARVVGPSWEGVTERRKPEWIMNMITNVDVMLEKDPEAQKLLEECLTRMPNQNVSIGDARDILEFMLSNDQAK